MIIQRRLTHYLEHERYQTKDGGLLRKLRRIANMFSIQYALLWYIYLRNQTTLRELYSVYGFISGKLIRENTVRKQLQILESKGLVKRVGNTYIALIDPREVEDLFDRERSRAGKIGATIRHMRLQSKSPKISPGLRYYTESVIKETQRLLQKGKRAVALDLMAHTLLPLRENAILWLWHKDLFIYYEPKTKIRWRAIKSEEIAKLLKRLGYSEGIMIFHILGHKEASKIVKKIFARGPYSWPWARSISYGLKQLGMLHEVDTLYRIQLKKLGNKIELILWNLYTREQLCKYETNWKYEAPEPLKSRHYILATVLGKQHVRKEIEINSYSSKWRR